MGMDTYGYKYIKFIDYKSLTLWDVKRYVHENISFKNSVKLREILHLHIAPISKEEMLVNNWQIISKINFSGDLFLRGVNEAKTFKGNLNKVDSDTLIYSKINARHGCIYYHPKNSIPFGVSLEYPAYKIDSTKVCGEYLVMVLRSNFFKTILNKKVTGISKARLKSNEFLDTEIPLLTLTEQETLVSAFKKRIKEATDLELKAEQAEQAVNSYLLDMLDVDKGNEDDEEICPTDYKFMKFIRNSQLSEWGINQIQSKQKQKTFKYPIVKIRDLCQLGSGGTPSRACLQYYSGTIPWIKTGEVVNEEIFETEEHITEEAIVNSSAKIYPKGSLIIAMYGQGDTRGRTAKMGIDATTNQACAVLHNIDNNIVSTDYLWYYLQGRYHDLRSLASGNNQPNLNAGKINNFDVVVPPTDIQSAIVAHIKQQKILVKQLRHEGQTKRTEALKEFENEIFK